MFVGKCIWMQFWSVKLISLQVTALLVYNPMVRYAYCSNWCLQQFLWNLSGECHSTHLAISLHLFRYSPVVVRLQTITQAIVEPDISRYSDTMPQWVNGVRWNNLAKTHILDLITVWWVLWGNATLLIFCFNQRHYLQLILVLDLWLGNIKRRLQCVWLL